MNYLLIILFQFVLYYIFVMMLLSSFFERVCPTVIKARRCLLDLIIPNSSTISTESPRRGPTIRFLPTSAHTVVAGWLRSAAARQPAVRGSAAPSYHSHRRRIGACCRRRDDGGARHASAVAPRPRPAASDPAGAHPRPPRHRLPPRPRWPPLGRLRRGILPRSIPPPFPFTGRHQRRRRG